MKRFINISIWMVSAFILLFGCATGGSRGNGNGKYTSFVIKPSGQYEQCFELKPGTVMEYSFETSDFVNFNVHYHAGESLKLPIYKKGVLMAEGVVNPADHDYYNANEPTYCMMWINPNEEAVKGSYRVNLRKQ